MSGGGPTIAGEVGPPPRDRKENVLIRDDAWPNCPAFVPVALCEEIALDISRARLGARLLGDELLLYLIDVAAEAARRNALQLRLAAVRADERASAAPSPLPTA